MPLKFRSYICRYYSCLFVGIIAANNVESACLNQGALVRNCAFFDWTRNMSIGIVILAINLNNALGALHRPSGNADVICRLSSLIVFSGLICHFVVFAFKSSNSYSLIEGCSCWLLVGQVKAFCCDLVACCIVDEAWGSDCFRRMLSYSESKRMFFFTPSGNSFPSGHTLWHWGVVMKFSFEIVVEEGVLIFGRAGAEACTHLRVLSHVVGSNLACLLIAVWYGGAFLRRRASL